ncbi:MAG: lysylphosphatidylglycerol synthase transmembrane domain-containing protein [Desulforegulaceae bacterium]|nr:lysylphosphatidylglycerol synthase transmembrane domain-containing protein [Desulforegulaceae bacterium]
MRKNLISYFFLFFLLTALFFWIDLSDIKILFKIKVHEIFYSIIFALIIYFFSGLMYLLTRKHYGVKINFKDIILLPAAMNFWGFIFPFQGSLFFTTIYFKQKYNMKVTESFSINIYLYMVNLIFTGFIGLFFAISTNIIFSWFSFICLLLALSPLSILIIHIIFYNIKIRQNRLFYKIKIFYEKLSLNIYSLWSNKKLCVSIFFINIFKILTNICWFYWISKILSFNLSFISITLISLFMMASIIIKITPGNLGVTQLLTGGMMGLAGLEPESAILITLLANATTILIIFSLGLISNIFYFKTINLFYLINSKKD